MNMPHLIRKTDAHRHAGRPFGLVCAALALLSSGPVALAQAIGSESGRYLSDFWLIMFILQCVVWIAVFDWVGATASGSACVTSSGPCSPPSSAPPAWR